MEYLIRDILELSKLNDTTPREDKPIVLDHILKKALTNLKEEIDESGAILCAEPLPEYICNESEFLLVFQNVIQNGIKYNQSKTPIIQIWAEQSEAFLYIHFKDNGIGIPEEYYDKIFQYFQRLHHSNDYTGTGLGLGLCNKIINRYNGQILVDSVLEQGTTFTLQLPIHSSSENANQKEGVLYQEQSSPV